MRKGIIKYSKILITVITIILSFNMQTFASEKENGFIITTTYFQNTQEETGYFNCYVSVEFSSLELEIPEIVMEEELDNIVEDDIDETTDDTDTIPDTTDDTENIPETADDTESDSETGTPNYSETPEEGKASEDMQTAEGSEPLSETHDTNGSSGSFDSDSSDSGGTNEE